MARILVAGSLNMDIVAVTPRIPMPGQQDQREAWTRWSTNRNGEWIDVGFWQRELNDATIPPVEPKPFSEVGLVRS